jgi:hypothetical protein
MVQAKPFIDFKYSFIIILPFSLGLTNCIPLRCSYDNFNALLLANIHDASPPTFFHSLDTPKGIGSEGQTTNSSLGVSIYVM